MVLRTKGYQPDSQANGTIRLRHTKAELAQYLVGASFSPSKSSLLRAIRRHHFTNWPGLTTNLINKYLPKTIATAKGHLDQEFKNLRLTKK